MSTTAASAAPGAVAPVFADLVGQPDVAELLTAAAQGRAGRAMTHAWLFTGPPGSGRSVAASGFAAALQCPAGGCGTCQVCASVLAGRHPDVEIVVPEGLHLRIAQARAVVVRAARAPSAGVFQITIIEDVDRMEEATSNTLLRALEEPPPRAVFLLCAPSPEDLLATIRSRCRQVTLRVPATQAIVEVLTRRDLFDRATAELAAQASGGHIGRARRLAGDPEARRRRSLVLGVPLGLGGVPAALRAADLVVAAAEEEAGALTAERDQAERAELERALGVSAASRPRGAAGALAALAEEQRSRATRAKRDSLDRTLLDLASFYRDVLAVRLGADVPLNCPDAQAQVRRVAGSCPEREALRRIEVVLAARSAIQANVSPLIAVTAMMLHLRDG